MKKRLPVIFDVESGFVAEGGLSLASFGFILNGGLNKEKALQR